MTDLSWNQLWTRTYVFFGRTRKRFIEVHCKQTTPSCSKEWKLSSIFDLSRYMTCQDPKILHHSFLKSGYSKVSKLPGQEPTNQYRDHWGHPQEVGRIIIPVVRWCTCILCSLSFRTVANGSSLRSRPALLGFHSITITFPILPLVFSIDIDQNSEHTCSDTLDLLTFSLKTPCTQWSCLPNSMADHPVSWPVPQETGLLFLSSPTSFSQNLEELSVCVCNCTSPRDCVAGVCVLCVCMHMHACASMCVVLCLRSYLPCFLSYILTLGPVT